MRTEILTVKLPAEVMADLEGFAQERFPRTCPKCQAEGTLVDGTTCPTCNGVGTVGNRSEAARFLLHYALGERTGPEARAMMAAYGEIRSRLLAVVTRTAHRLEAGFREDMIAAIRQTLDD